MSQKTLKTMSRADIRPFRSDPSINVLAPLDHPEDQVDFASLLKSSIHATIKSQRQLALASNKTLELLNKSLDMDLGVSVLDSDSQGDISRCANQIIANALHIPRCLYCPFCAAEYMFEFTLKDHLKKRHGNEIMEMAARNQTITDMYEINTCPFCGAVFYHFALVPLHLAQHHDPEILRQWQAVAGNMTQLMNKKGCCPSIELIGCSPDLSKMMGSLDISGTKDTPKNAVLDTPTLKSILKRKTNYSGKIIFSPSSASLRRIGDDVTRRSNNSVRRELRFDLPPAITPVAVEHPLERLREEPKTKKKRAWFRWATTSDKPKDVVDSLPVSRRSSKHQSSNMNSTNQPITSTPISFLDGPAPFTVPKTRRRWLLCGRRAIKVPKLHPESSSFVPSFFASERFCCRLCKKRYDDNAELLNHLKKEHGRLRRMLVSPYECGQCKAKFYRNSDLVRHCHFHHTPRKRY